VSHPDHGVLYALNEAVESLSRVDLETGETQVTALRGRPGRLARAGDLLYVTLRSERSLLVFQETGELLDLVSRSTIGHEPMSIVVHPSLETLYVALAGSGAVVELATSDLSELRRWKVDDEPRWLALPPDGCDLYVASGFGGRLSHVALDTSMIKRITLPSIERTDGISATLTPRLTGDLSVRSRFCRQVLRLRWRSPVFAATRRGRGRGGSGGGSSVWTRIVAPWKAAWKTFLASAGRNKESQTSSALGSSRMAAMVGSAMARTRARRSRSTTAASVGTDSSACLAALARREWKQSTRMSQSSHPATGRRKTGPVRPTASSVGRTVPLVPDS
jgi:hypothetical protein